MKRHLGRECARRKARRGRLAGAALVMMVALGVTTSAAAPPGPDPPGRAVSKGVLCGRLIDGRSSTPRGRTAILIEGDRISRVGGPDILPEGIEIIDLGNATVIPGLIDLHSHPLQSTDSYQVDHLRWSSAYKALKGLKAAQDSLMSGWTTRCASPGTPTCSTLPWTSARRSTRGC